MTFWQKHRKSHRPDSTPAEPQLAVVISGAAGALTLSTQVETSTHTATVCFWDMMALGTETSLAHHCLLCPADNEMQIIKHGEWKTPGEDVGGREGMWHMCLHGWAFLVKADRQTDFTAGSNTVCPRCHSKKRMIPPWCTEGKLEDMVTSGNFHTLQHETVISGSLKWQFQKVLLRTTANYDRI